MRLGRRREQLRKKSSVSPQSGRLPHGRPLSQGYLFKKATHQPPTQRAGRTLPTAQHVPRIGAPEPEYYRRMRDVEDGELFNALRCAVSPYSMRLRLPNRVRRSEALAADLIGNRDHVRRELRQPVVAHCGWLPALVGSVQQDQQRTVFRARGDGVQMSAGDLDNNGYWSADSLTVAVL